MIEKATQILGWQGRMMSGSKSGYCKSWPENIAVFNANVIALDQTVTKIWYGDLDITKDIDKLKDLSREIGIPVLVLREMDARFEHEENPNVDAFVVKVGPVGDVKIGDRYRDVISDETLKYINR